MKGLKYFLLVNILTLLTQNTSAMDMLDEQDLSETVAKDGISLSLAFPNSTISYDEIRISDHGGINGSTTHNSIGSIVIAPTTLSSSNGVRLLKADGSVSTAPIVVWADADSNIATNKPVANINLALPSDAKRIQISPFSVYLAPQLPLVAGKDTIFTDRTTNATRTGVRQLLSIGGTGINVNIKDNLVINVQMGNTPQGHMFKLIGSISCITSTQNCNLTDTIPVSVHDASGSKITFGFALKATDTNTGIRLNNVYGDVRSTGLILGADGDLDKFDANLTNITLGTTGSTNASHFEGLKNGAIGTIGLEGVKVSDLKMTIKGL